MFQRLLLVALFVVVAILVVRSIANWFNRGGWIGRGRTEIRGSWEVVEPLGRFGRAADKVMRSTLRLEEDELRRAAVLFDVAHRIVGGHSLDPAELRSLADEAPEAIRAGLYRGDALHAPGWLLYAADRVQDAHPDMYAYEVKRITLSAYREIFPDDTRTDLPPERTLAPVSYGSPPDVDDRYGHLGSLGTEYDQDAVYASLLEGPAESLPDGAMLPLLRLLYETEMEQAPDKGIAVDELLARYGERLYAAAVHCMIRPESTETDRSTAYSPALFRLIGTWPRTSAEPLFRAALESGWNDCVRFLPDAGWARDLRAVFRDSPYGAPA
jgi:hypothetical protein